MKQLAADCLQQFLLNELKQVRIWQKALLKNTDPENVHQLRICLRKIHTALRLSQPILKRGYCRRWQKRLRRLAKQLDAARDLDVLILSIKPASDTKFSHKQLLKQQKNAYKKLRLNLTDGQFSHSQKFLKQLKKPHWIQKHCSKNTTSFRELASDQLDPIYEAINQVNGQISKMDDDALHRLRIRCKQLRYGCEYATSVLKKKKAIPFLSTLKQLQDHLGQLHDAQVQQTILGRSSADISAVSIQDKQEIEAELKHFLELTRPWASV